MRKTVFLNEGELLNRNEELAESGFSYDLIKTYNSRKVLKYKWRLKEWDYYYLGNNRNGIGLVLGDNYYVGQIGFVIFDFKNKTMKDASKLVFLPKGSFKMPSDSSKSIRYEKDGNFIEIDVINDEKRIIKAHCSKASNGRDLDVEVILQRTNDKSMTIATPFKKPKHFYYNQKINNFVVSGKVMIGNSNLNSTNDFMGTLDWGRGVWTYKNTWNWLSFSTKQGSNYVGLNLGYGFGDTTNANENVLFINNEAFKLGDVKFYYQKSLFLHKIKLKQICYIISTNPGDIELEFKPVLLRYSNINALIIHQRTNQIFGYFSGKIRIGKNGEFFEINNAFGFFENVMNRW